MQKAGENQEGRAVSLAKEDDSLKLLTPVPEKKLMGWLEELYGKPVKVTQRQVLRHRDLSYVERLFVLDALPESIIYKLVLPPWDVEQDLHERVLIPGLSNSPQLFMSAYHEQTTALFIEDLGPVTLEANGSHDLAVRLGEELARMHRSYCYRSDELISAGVLRALLPIDYEEFAIRLGQRLEEWQLIDREDRNDLVRVGKTLARALAGEPTSLVHGDMYAENIILRHDHLFIIDWSWFTIIGVPLMDLATLTMEHKKNGSLNRWKETLVDAYSYEAGRDVDDVRSLLPYAEALSRLTFLDWLAERRSRGILGTTVGPVDRLIPQVVQDLATRSANWESGNPR